MGRHKYLSGFRLDLRHRAQAFVILVTPAFAEWLKDDFIEDVIRTMTYHFGHRISKRVTVVSAVVDGLAPSPDDIPIAERVGPLQGISILYGLKHQILSAKSMWKPESFKDTSKDPDKLSHLILLGQIPIKQRESSLRVSISLPLANTLFVNGQHSTLEVSQWMRSSRDRYTLVRSAQKQYQHIKAFYHGNTMIPPIFVPAVPLTLPRRIASGLGNIVRQLSFERRGGDIRPASSELETQVTRYMKFSKLHTTIGVWALIYRKELLDPNLKATTLERTEELQSTWGNDDENLRFVGTRLALGAILCRVGEWLPLARYNPLDVCKRLICSVSGGGGWGAKQGLLSLDPQITHGDIPSAGADYISDSMQESQNPTLGNLARPGDYIQFFTIKPSKLKDHKSSMEESSPSTVALGENPSVAGDGPPDSKYITKQPEISGLASKEYNDIDWSKRVVFGVVPSTIDELPKSDTTEASSSRNGTVPLAFRKGEFGAVSESGVYLYAPHKRGINSTKFEHINTKIDMPYSFLYIDQLVTLPPREPGKSKLKPSLGSTGSSDIKNVSSASESAKESQSTTTGKRPSQKGAAEVSGQQNASTSKANQVSDSTIRKTRVGHTRWPKFLPKKEKPKKEKPLNIRKIKTHHKERTFRFRLDENRSS